MAYIYENANDKQECSSGCESGWTLYLQHSSDSLTDDDHHRYFSAVRTNHHPRFSEVKRSKQLENELIMSEEEEEDMSMVSDASSGPRHSLIMHEEEDNETNDFVSANDDSFNSSVNRKKNKEKRRRKVVVVPDNNQTSSTLLDDTASSPCLDFVSESYRASSGSCKILEENVLEYSQGYSTTHHYNESRVPYDFFNTSPSGNQMGHNQWF